MQGMAQQIPLTVGEFGDLHPAVAILELAAQPQADVFHENYWGKDFEVIGTVFEEAKQ